MKNKNFTHNCQTFHPVQNFVKAFTLAEVLITIMIIGIVAALTVGPFLINYKEKMWQSASSAFQKKLGEAMQNMDIQNKLVGYDTTEEFINTLQKYIKITKVCDKSNLQNCFPSKIKDEMGNKKDVSIYNTSAGLNRETYNTNTVGVVFIDGTSALIAYNPKIISKGANAVKLNSSSDRKTITLSTSAIAMMFDVSGTQNPNTIGSDIYTVNTDSAASSDCTTLDNGMCIKVIGKNYMAISCQNPDNEQYCDNCTRAGSTWAGANKACQDLGLRLPTKSELVDMANARTTDSTGIIPESELYWASDSGGMVGRPGAVNMGSGGSGDDYDGNTLNVLCVK